MSMLREDCRYGGANALIPAVPPQLLIHKTQLKKGNSEGLSWSKANDRIVTNRRSETLDPR